MSTDKVNLPSCLPEVTLGHDQPYTLRDTRRHGAVLKARIAASLLKEFPMLKHLVSLGTRISEIRSEDRGVTSVEYGLMVALIAIVIIAAVTLLGKNLSTLFNNVAGAI
jgi:pilus assembly protein Flp/PilA